MAPTWRRLRTTTIAFLIVVAVVVIEIENRTVRKRDLLFDTVVVFPVAGAAIGQQQGNVATNNDTTQDPAIASRGSFSLRTNYYDNRITGRNITLIAQLKGELCNQLAILANARITQFTLAAKNYSVTILGQHQDHPKKWVQGRDDIQACFPNLRSMDFEGGIWDEQFEGARQQQETSLTQSQRDVLVDLRWVKMQEFEEILEQQQPTYFNESSSTNKYSVPHLTAKAMSWTEIMRNASLYHDMRRWMEFDDDSCCRNVPEQHETVFHFRNFVGELKKRAFYKYKKYDISPQNALQLFQPNTSIAIISRYTHNLQPYVDILEAHGHSVRIIRNQTGVQDFCFLKQARSMVGSYGSTYSRWAGTLGQAQTVKLYDIVVEETKDKAKPTSASIIDIPNGRRIIIKRIYQPEPLQLGYD